MYQEYLEIGDKLKNFESEKASLDLKIRELKARQKELTTNIVNYFNDNGLVNEDVQYGDITLRFKLTKPTGRMVVSDISAIPSDYISYDPKVDKKGLKDFLKNKDISQYGVEYEYGEPNITYKVV